MAEADFLLLMSAGAAFSWACYNVVAHVVLKQHISTLRAIAWGTQGTLSLVLSVFAFSAIGAEQPLTKQNALCSGNSPECYAKTHHNPIRECKQAMDKEATFRHVWQENGAQPVFGAYLWHDEKNKTIQAFGHQASAINSLGMLTPLQYFCVYNANTGDIIAASFE
ncbi:hypothetical protein B1H58_04760 [Pantoea alhagi]|uniref:Transmembrane protein n=1 Tax=Pantoea alhagi TaxID=1891675 RepID=A0A1W6B2R0_9GAMM|nr:hypothetical protein [Pantoea alhagi]ARJ41385.1 hypothetical protein B1H58_04760 [Pantoea alhagi]